MHPPGLIDRILLEYWLLLLLFLHLLKNHLIIMRRSIPHTEIHGQCRKLELQQESICLHSWTPARWSLWMRFKCCYLDSGIIRYVRSTQKMNGAHKLVRSVLFAPADRLKVMQKSLQLAADVIIFDLEDRYWYCPYISLKTDSQRYSNLLQCGTP